MVQCKLIRSSVAAASLFIFLPHAGSQNLFANPGFEDLNICTEYHTQCTPEAWFNIPATIFMEKVRFAQSPVLGHMILPVPVANVTPGFTGKKRLVYTMLACPLVRGEKYELSFYIAAPQRSFERLDFCFTGQEPTLAGFERPEKTATFSITEQHIDAVYKTAWYHVRYGFTARDNSQFCVIGSFSPLRHVYTMKDAMNASGDILYFIDEISLKPLSGDTLCSGYKNNIEKIYAQNYRHTENIAVTKDTPLVLQKMQFMTDTVTIPSVLFDLNSAVIKPAVARILDSVINRISSRKIAKIEINGHSDNTGTVATNDVLSLSRAGAVKKYLAEKLPELSEQMFVSGKGQKFPVADNNTMAGRQKNRRVEIILTAVIRRE